MTFRRIAYARGNSALNAFERKSCILFEILGCVTCR